MRSSKAPAYLEDTTFSSPVAPLTCVTVHVGVNSVCVYLIPVEEPQAPLSSGSGRSATCFPGDATPWSPRIGWSEGVPASRQIA